MNRALPGRPYIDGVSFQLPSFMLVGVLNTFVDAMVFAVLVTALGVSGGMPAAALSAVAYLVGALNSYVWNSRVTFAVRHPSAWRYAVVTASSLGLSVGVFQLASMPLTPGAGALMFAKAAALLATVLFNFVLCRSWAFR
ncbi:MAG: GtrA family protein [Dehalococcoidia bacterium]|nr:GtrA family protein [Dehalococcoidia bacterium]